MKYGSITAPAADIFVVTPNDATVQYYTSLWVMDGGDLEVETEAGQVVVIESVPPNTFIPLRVNKVLANNTTATEIYGLRD